MLRRYSRVDVLSDILFEGGATPVLSLRSLQSLQASTDLRAYWHHRRVKTRCFDIVRKHSKDTATIQSIIVIAFIIFTRFDLRVPVTFCLLLQVGGFLIRLVCFIFCGFVVFQGSFRPQGPPLCKFFNVWTFALFHIV